MLEVHDLSKSFGAVQVTRGVSLTLVPGERRVLLGPNGAGKTTFFNLLVGELAPDAGTILIDGQDVTTLPVHRRARLGLARSYQKNNLFPGLTVFENLGLAAATAQGRAGAMWHDTLRAPAIRDRVEQVADTVGLSDRLRDNVETIPYGVRRQLELGLALATGPRLLLMDEPTSGLGPDTTHAFHGLLKALPRDLTVLIVEHDMDLAFDVADRVSVLNYGEMVFEGVPAEARNSQLVRDIYLGHWDA